MPVDVRSRRSTPQGRWSVHKCLRKFLAARGVRQPSRLIDYPGAVVGGHTDRHVVRVKLGRLVAYLKKEHRVPRSVRLQNYWDGFGFVSLSTRERTVLKRLRQAGVRVPSVAAHGADENGREFLLLNRLPGISLRQLAHDTRAQFADRAAIARRLGQHVGKAHMIGVDQPDLLCKHVIVDLRNHEVGLIDWQRSRLGTSVSRQARCRDLAALHASLADQLVSIRERLRCLAAYCRQTQERLRDLVPLIRQQLPKQLRRRSVRECRLPPAKPTLLRWMDGERLCVTPELARLTGGVVPEWLKQAARKPEAGPGVTWVDGQGRPAMLLRCPPSPWYVRLWSYLRYRRPPSPATQSAGLLTRLRQYRVPSATLFAFGRRGNGRGFLLVERVPGSLPAVTWPLLDPQGRRRFLKASGRLLRGLHQAGCRAPELNAIRVVLTQSGRPKLYVANPAALSRCRRLTDSIVEHDIISWLLALGPVNEADRAVLSRAYWGDRA